ncbi:MAG TPA: hypothetical protein VG797_06800 [Phycisphaerales bacterium]|nr:hypothetical protein [Phycisphaerales bacterium]
MRDPFVVILSPYDLSRQTSAAMSALLLADQVVTFLPLPAGGAAASDISAAFNHSPRYERFMDSWRWTRPLWREANIVAAAHGDLDPLDDIHDVAMTVQARPELVPLLPLLNESLFADDATYLDTVSRDLLGGMDPGIYLPLSAGLERFASRASLPLLRTLNGGAADRGCRSLTRVAARIEVPILLDASGELILHARRALHNPLNELLAALSHECHVIHDVTHGVDDSLPRAASAYTAAFTESVGDSSLIDDEAGRRARPALISLAVGAMPSDATLRSAAAALGATGKHAAPKPGGTIVAAPPALGPLVVLDIKELPWDFGSPPGPDDRGSHPTRRR